MEIIFDQRDYWQTLKDIETINKAEFTKEEKEKILQEILDSNLKRKVKKYTRKLIKRSVDKVIKRIYTVEKDIDGINCILKGKAKRILTDDELINIRAFFSATIKYNRDLINPTMLIGNEYLIKNVLMNKLNNYFSEISFTTEKIKE